MRVRPRCDAAQSPQILFPSALAVQEMMSALNQGAHRRQLRELGDLLRPKVTMVRTRPRIRRNHSAGNERSPSRYAKAFAMKRGSFEGGRW